METPIKEGQRWDRKSGGGFVIIKFIYGDSCIVVGSNSDERFGMNKTHLKKNYTFISHHNSR